MSRSGEDVLFKCLPPETEPKAGRFPGPVHTRGKWFTIDIHCHVRCEKAAAMVEGDTAVSRWFLETSASERSREINRQNGVRTRVQGSSPEKRIDDMDRMGIDIQAISPAPRQTYYGADPDLGLEASRAINDYIAEICGRYPDRFVGLGTVPFQAPELAISELGRLHKSAGFRGIEIMTHVAGEDLSPARICRPNASARSSLAAKNWAFSSSCIRTASPKPAVWPSTISITSSAIHLIRPLPCIT
jgi:aminocarboxymuconate-semialdehyde decarboxylase